MKILAVAIAMSGMCVWAQSLDLTSLEKLAAKAKEVNRISLDRNQLQSAGKMLSDDDAKKVLSGLGSIQVRNLEFDKEGEFSDSDLDAVRAQIAKMQSCSAIVDSKEKNEHSQIFLCGDEGKGAGLAIVSAEPKELSVVYIRGNVSLSDLSKLDGVMGIPDLTSGKSKSDRSKSDQPKSDQK